MKILLLPIEPIEKRYTEQWTRWFRDGLAGLGHEVDLANGPLDTCYEVSKPGQFLDPIKTWTWKGGQLASMAQMLEQKRYDWVLNLDGWGPASTAIPYINGLRRTKVKSAIYWHAGMTDPYDALARCLPNSMNLVEQGWLQSADLVLLPSESHRKTVMARYPGLAYDTSLAVVGNPIKTSELRHGRTMLPHHERSLVLFPHRHAPEKLWWEFLALEGVYRRMKGAPAAKFAFTRDHCHRKPHYYDMLAQGKVVFSAALQETFGISNHEAICLGCWPLLMDTPAHREIVERHGGLLFNQTPWGQPDIEHAASQLARLMTYNSLPEWSDHHDKAVERVAAAMAR